MPRDDKARHHQGRKSKTRPISVSRRVHRSDAARERALKALWAIRQGDTLAKAARDNGVTIRTIKRYAGSALVQDRPGGRIRATKGDRLVRYLQIPGPDGPRNINVRGSKAASKFANYHADINRLLRGDRHAMAKWHGKKIQGIEIITDTERGWVPLRQTTTRTVPCQSSWRVAPGAPIPQASQSSR
jgi:hypothetical protein